MICNKCGTEITKEGKFCPKCGESVPAVSGEIKISSSENGQKQDSGTLQDKQNSMKHLFFKHPKLIFSALAVVMVAFLFLIQIYGFNSHHYPIGIVFCHHDKSQGFAQNKERRFAGNRPMRLSR